MIENIIFAFSTGFVSFLSPCSLPLLPAYVSYYLEIDKNETNFYKTIAAGLSTAAGIILTFGVFWFLTYQVGKSLTPYIPYFNLFIGLILIVLGSLFLFGKSIINIDGMRAPKRKGIIGSFLFGIIYSIGIAGCTAPILFGVILKSFSASGNQPIYMFLSYSAAIISLMILITTSVFIGKRTIIQKMKNWSAKTRVIGGYILIFSGAYLFFKFLL